MARPCLPSKPRSEVFDGEPLPGAACAAGPGAPLSAIKPAYKETIPSFFAFGLAVVIVPYLYEAR